MKISLAWMNNLLRTELNVRELADAIEKAGIEVEEIIESIDYDSKIVVGKIQNVDAHPNADRLRVATVDTGGETLQIVCGAPNIAAGQCVPVALVGAVLPDSTIINESTIRGITSAGMLCSEKELGISSNHEGIMLLEGVVVGQTISDILTTDSIIDVKSAPNRWDWNSLRGIAQDVSAHIGKPANMWAYPSLQQSGSDNHTDEDEGLQVHIEKNIGVVSYILNDFKVTLGHESPQWLRGRLNGVGIRSLSAIVDITNYIMMEYGQPLHAFDADKVQGNVHVRLAGEGETLVTLDGVTRKLTVHDVVIADDHKAIALAGVMGGKNSEIDTNTTRVLLETAIFDAARTRKTALRHGMRTDASARYERQLPGNVSLLANHAAVAMLQQNVDAKTASQPYMFELEALPTDDIIVNNRTVERLIGMTTSVNHITSILDKLFIESVVSDGMTTVSPPWWRPDIRSEADIAEEVVKIIGLDALPAKIPAWRADAISFDTRWSGIWRAKEILRSIGLFEVSTYSFISEKQIIQLGWDVTCHVKLKNPLSLEQAYLRGSLLPSLLQVAHLNRSYAKEYGVFEFSRIFQKTEDGDLPNEKLRLGVVINTSDNGYKSVKRVLDRLASQFNVSVTVMAEQFDAGIAHPTRVGKLMCGENGLGGIAQIHPQIARNLKLQQIGYLEIEWDTFIQASLPKVMVSPSTFPISERDISIIVDRQISWGMISASLSAAGYNASFVNDFYGGNIGTDKKAIALRLTITNLQRTLKDSEISKVVSDASQVLVSEFNARIQ